MGFIVKAVKSVIKTVVGIVSKVIGGVFGFLIGGKSKKTTTPNTLTKTLDPEAFCKIHLGKTAAVLDTRYWEVYGSKGERFVEVINFACHRVNAILETYYENVLAFDAAGAPQGIYNGVVTRQTKLGLNNQTGVAVGSGTNWTAAATNDGNAYGIFDWLPDEKKLPNGMPTRVTQVQEGALVYDPRRDSTVTGGSGTHRVNDRTTWAYATLDGNGVPIGRNNCLQALWYLLGWTVPTKDVSGTVTGEMLRCGRGIDPTDINLASFIAGANACEAAGYYTDLVLSTEDDHTSNEDAITCSGLIGRLIDPGGLWSYYANVDDTATIAVDLTDADILEGVAVTWDEYKGMSDQYNQVRGKYINPTVNVLYQAFAYPMVRDATYEANLGVKRSKTQDFRQVLDSTLAQRLARLLLNQGQYQGEFTAGFNYRAARAQAWDVVRYTSERFGWVKLFRVWRHDISTNSGITMLLKEIDPSIWSAGTINPPIAPGAGLKYNPLQLIDPTNVTVTLAPLVGASGDKADGFRMSWDAPPTNVSRTEIRYRLVGTVYWKSAPPAERDVTAVLIGPELSGAIYEVAVRHISISEIPGNWVVPTTAPANGVGQFQMGVTGTVNYAAIIAAGGTATWTGITGTGKPQDNADVTLSHVSSGFTGQGSLSLLNNVTSGYLNVTIGGGNLLRNSSFETDPNADGTSAGFGAYNNDANALTFSRVAGRTGGFAQRAAWAVNTSTKGIYLISTEGIDNTSIWQANKGYVWSWYAKASGAAIGNILQVAWNHAPTTQTWLSNPPLTANWQRYSVFINFGAATLDGNGFISVSVGTSNGVSSVDYDDMQIEEGDVATAYAPRSNEFLPGNVLQGYLANDAARLGVNVVLNNGSTSATDAILQTSLGIASGFSGQGALSLLNNAAWASNISGRPAELTDGRITAGFDSSGDLVRNITTTRRNASNLLGYTGGATFAGELTADTTLSHISSGFTGQVAIATDTDAVARILSMRGDNYARNGNLIEGQTGYYFGNGAVYATLATGAPAIYGIKFPSGSSNSYVYMNNITLVPYAFPRIFASFDYYGFPAGTTVQVIVEAFDKAGASISSPASYPVMIATSGGVYSNAQISIDLPAGTMYFRAYVQTLVAPQLVDMFATNFRFAPTQRAATVGGQFSVNVTRATGALVADADAITLLGISSGFTGQGALSLLNTADWKTLITGAGKPANDAATTNMLIIIGNYSSVVGNTLKKFGGTHGAYEGGVRGAAQSGSAFISCRPITYDSTGLIVAGGWETYLLLDTSATNLNPLATGVWWLRVISAGGTSAIYLWKDGAVVASATLGAALTELTELRLSYKGGYVVATVDGVPPNSNFVQAEISGRVFYPKIIDYYQSGTNALSIRDVIYGSYPIQPIFGANGTVLRETGAAVTDALVVTLLGIASGFTGQGSLSLLNVLNPATSQLQAYGSVPVTIPDSSFTYTSTTTTVTISWPNMVIYRVDGTSISITASSQAFTGLSASTSYKVYPYMVDSGGTTGTVSFVTGGSGSPTGMFASTGSAAAAATMYGRGNVPLGSFVVATPASGGGGGGGGGAGWCFHETCRIKTPEGMIEAGRLIVGNLVWSPEGWAEIIAIDRKSADKWFAVYCDDKAEPGAIVTPAHVFYSASGDIVKASDLGIEDLIRADGNHCEVTRIELRRDEADMIVIELDEPHLFYGGEASLLSHNGNAKP